MRSAVIYSSDFLSRFRVHFHTRIALGGCGFDSRQRAHFLPICPPDRDGEPWPVRQGPFSESALITGRH